MDPINQSQHPRTQGAGVGDWEWEDLGALTECSEITELLQILEKHMLTRRQCKDPIQGLGRTCVSQGPWTHTWKDLMSQGPWMQLITCRAEIWTHLCWCQSLDSHLHWPLFLQEGRDLRALTVLTGKKQGNGGGDTHGGNKHRCNEHRRSSTGAWNGVTRIGIAPMGVISTGITHTGVTSTGDWNSVTSTGVTLTGVTNIAD